jgi:hypothetical protein
MYYDIKNQLLSYILHLLLELVDHMNDVLCLAWLTKLASQVQHAIFLWTQNVHVTYDISKNGGVGHNKKGNLGSCHYFYETTMMLDNCYKFDK